MSDETIIGELSKSIERNVAGVVRTGKIMCNAKLRNKRFIICYKCDDHYDKDKDRCKVCRCFIKMKVPLLHEECPIGKW